jgi:hypothetical protein
MHITVKTNSGYIGILIKKIEFDCPFSDLVYLISFFIISKKKNKENFIIKSYLPNIKG